MKTITLTLTHQQIESLQNQYSNAALPPKNHMSHYFKLPGCTISVYQSMKVVFQGEKAQTIASQFIEKTDFIPHSGSDEVGTGDYFGPIVVCACYVDEKAYQQLAHLKIMDSKQLNDDEITLLAPEIMNTTTYALNILDNQKYNEIHSRLNLNAIKARLHHNCYKHLFTKLGFTPKLNVVDQFAQENLYYHYLQDDYQIRQLHFETKAENKYFAVACAAIIARYHFLVALAQMSKLYQLQFPKGAGSTADEFGLEFVKKHGQAQLIRVCKYHFKNTQKILESM